ncbi:MAG: RagB/SusD family nutrient uptake outer membrane protein [Bacteroidaceae bacterium]|nr:RagB/SusD family nutrient uptake outer membrane protein [Bacteroidaceae bacterium]
MKKLIYSIFVFGAAMALNSCEKELDIAQHGVLNYDTYYQTDEEAESGVTALYLEARGMGMNYILGKNMLTDDFWAGGASRADNADLEALNEFTFGSGISYLEGMFTGYYQIVYKANVVLGHVDESSEVKKRCRAEAKVFRAWAYFELTSMWGNPPLVDHELLPSEYSCPNGSTEQLWGLVENDLKEAIASGALSEKTAKDDATTWRVTKQFAQAVLGKAYLWQGKNKEAAEAFDAVINSNLYELFPSDNYGNILSYNTKHNCESICEFNRVKDPNNIMDNFDMTYVMLGWRTDRLNIADPTIHPSNGWGFVVPQKNLYDDFVKEEGVLGHRLVNTIKTYAQLNELGVTILPGNTMIGEGYFNWKLRYEPEAFGSEIVGMIHHQNMRIMRYAEVLLLAAEANLGIDQTKADNYYNQVRIRAKLPVKPATLEAIQLEKRLELCAEGTRYQDLIRWGIAYDRLKDQGAYCPILDSNGQVEKKVYNRDPSKFGFKKGKHERLPYPAKELSLNPNIQPNPGW